MEEKSNVSRFTVSLSTEGNNALNAIMTLTNHNPNREKSNVIDEAIQFYFSYLSGQLNMAASTADKSKHLCSWQQTAYLRSSLNKLLKQTC